MVGTYPSEKNNLADFLNHGADVQQRWYIRTQSAASAARMSNILTKTILGKETTDEDFAPQVYSTNNFISLSILSFRFRK